MTTTVKLEQTLNNFGIHDHNDLVKISLLKLRLLFDNNQNINYVPQDANSKALFRIYNYFQSLN